MKPQAAEDSDVCLRIMKAFTFRAGGLELCADAKRDGQVRFKKWKDILRVKAELERKDLVK